MTEIAEFESVLVCPRCKTAVRRDAQGFVCSACTRIFPIRFGIPDFRIFADPYISIDKEVEKIAKIIGAGSHSFSELIDRYYEFSPEVSSKLQPRYKDGLKAGVERAQNFLDQAEKKLRPETPILEIGCGTAGLIVEASRRYARIAGVDIALRWLVIGKQRLKEFGVDAPLFCANAEALPFAESSFGCVLSDSTLEHSSAPERFVKELKRVLRPGGNFFVNTANRFSLLESYTGFPLAGLLPRKLRWKMIERIWRTPYRLNPLSHRELRTLFMDADKLEVQAYKPWTRSQDSTRRFYAAMTQMPIAKNLLAHTGFFLSVSGSYRS